MQQELVDVVCRHLALVAVDGAGESVADTLHDSFRVHIDGLTTGTSGYFALIDARWAAEGERPPLDVRSASPSRSMVTVAIDPRCVVHVRVEDDRVAEMWITSDWRRWLSWLDAGVLS